MQSLAADNAELLRFAHERDDAAFVAIVREHVGLVYLAALRRVGEANLAEDVTQAVFMILAKKAGSVRKDVPLSAWLLMTVKYAAANAIKLEKRRRKHEREAARLNARYGAGAASGDPSEVLVWQEVAGKIDEAVLKLPRDDRRVVLMRYFEERPVHEIAAEMNSSEGAVRQRLSRALEKLRARLDRAGACVGAISIEQFAQMLATHAAAPPPAGLAKAVCVAMHAGAGATTGFTIAKGAMHMMNQWTRVKLISGIAAAVIVGGTGMVALNHARAQDNPPAAAAPAEKPEDKDAVSLTNAPPVVIRSMPVSGTNTVDPGLKEIKVTYSKDMVDGSWSWSTWGENTFPETTGKPHYMEDKRTCVLPVKLQPGKTYAIWLNSNNFGNFRDVQKHSAVPYLLVFKTRGG
jgi:RNA polymerase sigma factor (sigma-70 family)